MTVNEAIESGQCSTALVGGLSRQIIREMMAVDPGRLVPIASPRVHADPHVHLYLQPVPRASLMHVLNERPDTTLIINSCFRVLPEQLMLWRQYQEGRCGIKLAAPPADSPHEIAAAVDVRAALDWAQAFERHGWQYLGPHDPMHFQHIGNAWAGLGAVGVKAFQQLASRNGHALTADGVFGPVTEAALLAAPAAGWTG